MITNDKLSRPEPAAGQLLVRVKRGKGGQLGCAHPRGQSSTPALASYSWFRAIRDRRSHRREASGLQLGDGFCGGLPIDELVLASAGLQRFQTPLQSRNQRLPRPLYVVNTARSNTVVAEGPKDLRVRNQRVAHNAGSRRSIQLVGPLVCVWALKWFSHGLPPAVKNYQAFRAMTIS